MMLFTSLIFFCFIFVVICENFSYRSTVFGKVRGKVTSRTLDTEVEEYLGVPYAAPPVGHLRFKRPENPVEWRNTLDTTEIPPACPTHNMVYIQLHRPNFKRKSEDCLYMNIYVPKVEAKKLPVLLFIHGGDNCDGMGAMFDGDLLAARGGIIVITFNYRIGVLGFYQDASEGIEGNLGLLDQVKAMKWVQDNIHFFNGDPSKVTLHGHSAGAADVGLHIVSDMSKGLFRYAIIHSGSPLAFWFMTECVKKSYTTTIPKDCQAGRSRVSNSLRRKIEKLINNASIDDFMSSIILGEDSFRVTIDGSFLTNNPEIVLRCNSANAESVLFAFARDEGFEPRIRAMERYYNSRSIDIVFKNTYDQGLKYPGFEDDIKEAFKDWKENNISSYPHTLHMAADIGFFVPELKVADIVSHWLKQVYLLSFEYVSENIPGPDWIGVQHGWDLFYIFGIPLVGHRSHPYYSDKDVEVSKKTMDIFSNYVKYGYLTMNGSESSKPYDPKLRNYEKSILKMEKL